ncbi:MAG: hypothetical protein LKF36_10315 [Lactobacillus sp.]|jgi:hypothetical protein|nr:hypothetical protein [Lactobacillus sp.]
MKKTIMMLLTSAALLLVAAGCSNGNSSQSKSTNNGTYDTALANGKKAVSDDQFAQAEAYYKTASQIKTNDPKSSAYNKQAKALADAQKNITDLDFSKALANLKIVTNTPDGLSAMNSKAKTLTNRVNTIVKNRKALSKLYDTAKTAYSQGNVEQADANLSQLLSQDYIGQDAYADIRLDALTLKSNNSANAAKSGQTTSQVPATSTTASSSTSAAATSSSDAPAAEQSKAASGGEYTSSDNTVDGKAVTAQQIQTARDQLKSQGVDTAAWSNQDITQAIQNAAKDGRTTVKESDMTNFK